ncbi:MAG TPA: hypothetical protein VF885_16115 [Arthrobacter sp.]
MPDKVITLPDGRVMDTADYERRLALLSKAFEQDEIEKLPKQVKRNDDDRGKCDRGSRYSADGHFCGGYHARSMHLDYIGHAGITVRMNEVDPWWTWEPMGLTEAGTPLLSDGGMWGRMTVLGVTRIGYGDPGRNSGSNAIKETIGDFIRNAAMRFGVGTYLWSKSDAALAKKRGEEAHDDDPPQRRDESTFTETRIVDTPPAETPPAKIDWKAQYQATGGDVDKLKALRHAAKNAGAPDDFWLFNAIEKALNPAPLEGTTQA